MPVDEKLGTRPPPCLQASPLQNHIIVSDNLAHLQRLLVHDIATFLVRLGDEDKIQPANARHGDDGHNRLFLARPDNARLNE